MCVLADFISYDGFIGGVLVVVVGWWSGGYIGVGDHPLVFVVIYLSFLLCVTVVIVAVCSIATVR